MEESKFIFPFEKLDVWQMAVNLTGYVLELLEKILFNRHLRLVSQMEGAVVPIAQNIAEGKDADTKKNFFNTSVLRKDPFTKLLHLMKFSAGKRYFQRMNQKK